MTAANNISLPDPHYNSPGQTDTLAPPSSITLCTEETQSNTSYNERRIFIGDSRKRRRTQSIKNSTADDGNQALSWDAFQPYLEKCIPVKINNVVSFRNIVDRNGTSNEPVFPIISVDSLPSEVLDKTITVQCVPNLNCSVNPVETADDKIRQNARDIDAKISMLSNSNLGKDDEESIPTFMGQEDQVTSCMSLRELLSNNDTHNHDHMSASQLPIFDVDEIEQDSISLNVDGNLIHQPTANLELSPLASCLRLPSYLLLGNQHNESKDITIQSINLWHAPQSCCTNFHYDEHDNLLIVTSGVKVVELCPPGCIQASGVYSTHANHPKLLRRGGNMNVQREIQSTLERKNGRTHIVTVASGEALYIPLGWWHRVISKCHMNGDASREGNGCTAINVWFEYNHPSRQNNVPDHMAVFQLRQSSRKYFVLNKDYATNSLLEVKKEAYFRENEMPIVYVDEPLGWDEFDRIAWKEWYDINEIVFENEELDKSSILTFGMIYCRRISLHQDAVHMYHNLLEGFLLRIELGNASHVAGLVNMWTDVGNRPYKLGDILCMLSPETCYVLTQAWERHAGINTVVDDNGNAQDEAEKSYQHFFLILGKNRIIRSKVRNHLLNGVEELYHQAWVKLSSTI